MRGEFDKAIFQDEPAAREWLEGKLWPNGPVCPHCGTLHEATRVQGTTGRPGLFMCNACRSQFTVTVGTLYERSHVPLNKWLFAVYLMMASKKGMSAHQLHRMLSVTYKTAWFMAHRIREGLREGQPGQLGGEGKTVEFDETYIGGKEKNKHASKRQHLGTGGTGKEAVMSLVERGGRVHSHHIPTVTAKTLKPILREQIHAASNVYTDDGGARTGHMFAKHQSVNHSINEYVRGDVHTNTIEGYFSIMKRGIVGTYHHVSPQHLKRYLAEFDFRYNEREKLGVNDAERMSRSIPGIVGKRLTYRRTDKTKDSAP